jgi:8-oxo-dGTP diphosphatase
MPLSAPQIAVGVVVLSSDGAVLLIRRGKPPRTDEWSIPGGRQALGETVAACAVREVKEETGLDAKLIGLLDVVDGIFHGPEGELEYHYTLVDFAALADGAPVAGDDAREARWVPLEEIGQYKLWSETRRMIEAAIQRRAEVV